MMQNREKKNRVKTVIDKRQVENLRFREFLAGQGQIGLIARQL